MLKRPFLSIVFICMAIFSLAACGSNQNNGSGSTPTATATSTPTPTPSPTQVPFNVTSIVMVVKPTSIAGMACGTAITVTYTATFHIAANSPGGMIQFTYTVNNGRSSPSASVSVNPGQTTLPYSFTWSGNLPPDHTYPGLGGAITSSPNVVHSPLLKPNGLCS
jgi:hypothetical protein